MSDDHPSSTTVSPNLREQLERREIEAPGCRPHNGVYAQLLAVYLYEDDLCSAKFLWKRIPEQAKSECADLPRIWDVGKAMWRREPADIFRSIDEFEWSENVADIMKSVKAIVRDRSLELIGRAYTSISVSEFSRYIGLPEQEAVLLASKQAGWTVTDRATLSLKEGANLGNTGDKANLSEKMICPVRKQAGEHKTILAEKQLQQLTDFVAFLEK